MTKLRCSEKKYSIGIGKVLPASLITMSVPMLTDANITVSVCCRKPSRSDWVSRYRKGTTSLDLNEARDDGVLGWQWHQLDLMQIICTSLQTHNHTTTPSLRFYRLDALPGAQQIVSKHWRLAVVPSKIQTGLMTLCPGLSQYQKGKTNVDFTLARDSDWQWHQLGHMQVCTSLQADNHASTPMLSFFTGWMPFLPPNLQHQCTEASAILDLNAFHVRLQIFQMKSYF